MNGIVTRLSKRAPLPLFPIVFVAAAFRLLNRKMSGFRCRVFGVNLGRNNFIGWGIRFVYPWNIELGDNCTIGSSVRLWSEEGSGRLRLGDGVEIGRECVLDFTGNLTIEEGSLISEGCLIYTHDHGYDPHSEPQAQPLLIGKGAWIGARAIILPTVRRIGDYSIIGAGAVVSKDVPDNCIYVCASGRVLEKRQSTTT